MKYYPTSLGKLTNTLDSIEEKPIEKLAIHFINKHHYFSQIWQRELTYEHKRKILDIFVSGKGVIPYEKIKTIDSLSLQPENGFFYTRWIS